MRKTILCLLAATITACNGSKKNDDVTTLETDSINEEYMLDQQDDEQESEDGCEPDVCASEDGVVRILSAIYPYGGSSPEYWSCWKFRSNYGSDCEVYRYDSPFIRDVHAIRKDDGSTYYITRCYVRANSVDAEEWLEAHKIVGSQIVRVSVIDGSKYEGEENEYTDYDGFAIGYIIPDWYFATNGDGYDWIFEYDTVTKNLYVPLYDEYTLTDRYRVWHFNGKRFVDIGEKPHRDLHPSLAEYHQLIKCFETKDYIVRVDSLDSHELRYASWKKPKTIKDKPDVVIKGGHKKTYHVAPDQLCPCDDYRFTNDGYEYIVNYCETKQKKKGCGEHHDFLLIKKGGKMILKQEKMD